LENGVVNISNGLDPGRFQTTICCLNRLGSLTRRIENPGVRYLCFGEEEGKRPGLFLKIRRFFIDSRADIIHTHNFYSGVYGIIGARLANGLKIVHGEHGNHSFSGVMRRAALRYVYPLADRILTVSNSLKWALVRSGIPEAKVKPILNGVDTNRFRPSGLGTERRFSAGIKEPCVVFGYVGRISAEKGIDRLLKAFSLVHQRHADTRLMIVGDGPELDTMRDLAVALGTQGAVDFFGARDDIRELYQIFDVFVLPSLVEGLSNVVLEAMASGLAIVATDVGDNSDIIDDGQNGFIVPPNSVEALFQKMDTLGVDEECRSRLGGNALIRARSDFSLERMIRNYEDFYSSLVQ
jgi:glycosyltransferase involved in cell wall biosynthesis